MPDENGEPWGYELIHGTGSISTCDLDAEYDVDERAFPFGFQAPAPARALPAFPALTSDAWADWLTARL